MKVVPNVPDDSKENYVLKEHTSAITQRTKEVFY